MVWYLTLNPNIIVIQHIFLLLCSSMIFRWFVVVRCRSMLFVQESGGTKIEVYFPPFIFIIVIIVPSLRWVDLVCVCVCMSLCVVPPHIRIHSSWLLCSVVCVCVSVVRIALFVDYTMNSLRPNAMHRQKKSNNEYNGIRWKCTPLSIRNLYWQCFRIVCCETPITF